MQGENPAAKDETQSKPYQVRLPGFIADEAVGLGDIVSVRHMQSGSSRVVDASGVARQ